MMQNFSRCISASTRRLLVSRRAFSATSHRRGDPWVLPNSPEHLAQTTTQDIPPNPLPRPNESVDTLRARLVYQSRKRGTLESDLLLSTFAKDNLSTMSEAEMREYDRVSLWIVNCLGWWKLMNMNLCL